MRSLRDRRPTRCIPLALLASASASLDGTGLFHGPERPGGTPSLTDSQEGSPSSPQVPKSPLPGRAYREAHGSACGSQRPGVSCRSPSIEHAIRELRARAIGTEDAGTKDVRRHRLVGGPRLAGVAKRDADVAL